MDSIALRRALASDAPDIGRLILLSAEHFLPAIFGPGIAKVLDELAARRGSLFGHEHVWIAEQQGMTRGMLLGYPGVIKAAEDLRTGLALLRSLKADMIRRIGPLLAMQSAIGRIAKDEYYISNVAVYPDFRGRGIGAQLIGRAVEEAGRAGIRSVVLDVESDNAEARRLYERIGFRKVSETPPTTLESRRFVFFRMAMPLSAALS